MERGRAWRRVARRGEARRGPNITIAAPPTGRRLGPGPRGVARAWHSALKVHSTQPTQLAVQRGAAGERSEAAGEGRREAGGGRWVGEGGVKETTIASVHARCGARFKNSRRRRRPGPARPSPAGRWRYLHGRTGRQRTAVNPTKAQPNGTGEAGG